MLKMLRSHVSRHVVGYLALFVALGGTASALAANTVGTLQLRPFAVRNSDIGTLAVSASKLGNDAVGARVIRNPVIREASLGVRGQTGGDQQVFCAAGEALLAGGTRWLTANGREYNGAGVSVAYTHLVPLPGNDAVRARGNNATAGELRFVVQALCLPA